MGTRVAEGAGGLGGHLAVDRQHGTGVEGSAQSRIEGHHPKSGLVLLFKLCLASVT